VLAREKKIFSWERGTAKKNFKNNNKRRINEKLNTRRKKNGTPKKVVVLALT